jgi:hypothetical protein
MKKEIEKEKEKEKKKIYMVTARRTNMTTSTLGHVIITLMEIPVKSHTYKILKEHGITSAFDIYSHSEDAIPDLCCRSDR